MNPADVVKLVQGLLGAIPKIIKLVRAGRDPATINLDEVVSTDARAVLEGAKKAGQDFIDGG